jgi:hypothetical protein
MLSVHYYPLGSTKVPEYPQKLHIVTSHSK